MKKEITLIILFAFIISDAIYSQCIVREWIRINQETKEVKYITKVDSMDFVYIKNDFYFQKYFIDSLIKVYNSNGSKFTLYEFKDYSLAIADRYKTKLGHKKISIYNIMFYDDNNWNKDSSNLILYTNEYGIIYKDDNIRWGNKEILFLKTIIFTEIYGYTHIVDLTELINFIEKKFEY